jgi:GGDEF domain-containing protein
MQINLAALEFEFVDLALAVVLATRLEGQDLQVAVEPLAQVDAPFTRSEKCWCAWTTEAHEASGHPGRGAEGSVRHLVGALGRWSGRHRSRVATAGLALVLVLLAGFSVVAALRTNAAARQVNRDSTEQDVWQNARVELAQAEAARHAYTDHGRRDARDELTQSTQALRDALLYIVQHADPEDVRFAQQVGVDLERYRQATDRSLATVTAGDTTRGRRLEEQVVEPAAEELAEELEDGAQDEQEQAAASVAAQRQLGRTLLVAVPLVFTLGLGLLAGCWALLVGYQRRIKHQALTDALTGLPNRTLLYDRTGQAMRQADRELMPAALALIDLDRFKEVNDTLGHHYGDQLSSRSASGSRRPCARSTPWPAWAATSSPSSCRASRPARAR